MMVMVVVVMIVVMRVMVIMVNTAVKAMLWNHISRKMIMMAGMIPVQKIETSFQETRMETKNKILF